MAHDEHQIRSSREPSMQRCIFAVIGAAVLLSWPMAAAGEKSVLRVCLISGSGEYESDKTLPILQQHLEKNFAVKCTRAFAKGDDLPGLENLDQCDVAVLFTRR